MAASDIGGRADLAKLVEKQMRNWQFASHQRNPDTAPRVETVYHFITISRAVGCETLPIIEPLCDRVAWPLFDRQILQEMAGSDELRSRIYESMDERDLNWWEEVLRSLADRRLIRNDYYRRLCETALALARQGHGVFVGRAIDMILPVDRGLRVRIIAPLERRQQMYAEAHGLPLDKAAEQLAAIERERSEFVRHHFNVEHGDPQRYDLTINVARLTAADAVELILDAAQRRGLMLD